MRASRHIPGRVGPDGRRESPCTHSTTFIGVRVDACKLAPRLALGTRPGGTFRPPDIADPTLDDFHKENGTEIPGTLGRPLLKKFRGLPYSS